MVKPEAVDPIFDKLMVLGALAMNFLQTTHADALGHDHHCPVKSRPFGHPTESEVESCTCGWASFHLKFIELDAMGVRPLDRL
jgi:hypothetical protein